MWCRGCRAIPWEAPGKGSLAAPSSWSTPPGSAPGRGPAGASLPRLLRCHRERCSRLRAAGFGNTARLHFVIHSGPASPSKRATLRASLQTRGPLPPALQGGPAGVRPFAPPRRCLEEGREGRWDCPSGGSGGCRPRSSQLAPGGRGRVPKNAQRAQLSPLGPGRWALSSLRGAPRDLQETPGQGTR